MLWCRHGQAGGRTVKSNSCWYLVKEEINDIFGQVDVDGSQALDLKEAKALVGQALNHAKSARECMTHLRKQMWSHSMTRQAGGKRLLGYPKSETLYSDKLPEVAFQP